MIRLFRCHGCGRMTESLRELGVRALQLVLLRLELLGLRLELLRERLRLLQQLLRAQSRKGFALGMSRIDFIDGGSLVFKCHGGSIFLNVPSRREIQMYRASPCHGAESPSARDSLQRNRPA